MGQLNAVLDGVSEFDVNLMFDAHALSGRCPECTAREGEESYASVREELLRALEQTSAVQCTLG